jgi:hypothetical protein
MIIGKFDESNVNVLTFNENKREDNSLLIKSNPKIIDKKKPLTALIIKGK